MLKINASLDDEGFRANSSDRGSAGKARPAHGGGAAALEESASFRNLNFLRGREDRNNSKGQAGRVTKKPLAYFSTDASPPVENSLSARRVPNPRSNNACGTVFSAVGDRTSLRSPASAFGFAMPRITRAAAGLRAVECQVAFRGATPRGGNIPATNVDKPIRYFHSSS